MSIATLTTAAAPTWPAALPAPPATLHAFGAEEYRRRVTALQRALTDAGLAGLLLSSLDSICWASGYQTFGEAVQFLLVPAERDPVHVLRTLESGLVPYTSAWSDVVRFGDSDEPAVAVASAVREFAPGGPIAAELGTGGGIGTSLNAELVGRLPDGVSDGSAIVAAARVVKSPAEIELITRVARITDIGIAAAVETARPGVTENEVAAAAASAMALAGSEWLANDPIVTSGWRSGIPHTTYARRVIEPGDSVLVETSGTLYRYFSPLMRTIAIGPVPPHVIGLYDACRDALSASMAVIKPGITAGEAHGAAQDAIDAAGCTEYFKKRLGYAIGIGFKTWSEGRLFDLKAGDERELSAGMVFHMPPAVRIPNVCGAGVSETIVVTESGCERFGSTAPELFVR